MKNNRDYDELTRVLERVINKYMRTENAKNDYNTGIEITRSEIHALDVIGLNPGINVTELSKIQGITKGAVSKMIQKLKIKDLVIKKTSEISDAEVCILLTDKGKIAYDAHKEFHAKINKKIYEDLECFSDEQYKKFINLFSDLENMLDTNLSSKDK